LLHVFKLTELQWLGAFFLLLSLEKKIFCDCFAGDFTIFLFAR
jgi:hypothetical protein